MIAALLLSLFNSLYIEGTGFALFWKRAFPVSRDWLSRFLGKGDPGLWGRGILAATVKDSLTVEDKIFQWIPVSVMAVLS